jgi:hypothetical protein
MACDYSLEIPGDLETNTAAQAGADHDPTATLAAVTGAGMNDTPARSPDKPMSGTLPAIRAPSLYGAALHTAPDGAQAASSDSGPSFLTELTGAADRITRPGPARAACPRPASEHGWRNSCAPVDTSAERFQRF